MKLSNHAVMPSSWLKVRLADVADFVMGQAPPGSECNRDGKGAVFVKAGEFGSKVPIIREWTTKPLKFAREGDVLICVVGATAGKLNLGIDCAIGRSVAAIRPIGGISAVFVLYQLIPHVLRLRSASAGSAQGVISREDLEKIPFVIPPLDEQCRIVREIDSQFSRIDSAGSALQRAQVNLQRYCAAVLKAASEGRIVPTEGGVARQQGRDCQPIAPSTRDWERRVSPPSELLGDDPFPLPDGWRWITLGSVLSRIEAGRSFKCEERPPNDDEVGVVKVSAVTWGEFDEHESKTCTEPERITPEYFIQQGDFLFSRANTINLVGACVIAKRVHRRLMLSDKILRFHIADIPPEWVLYCLRSPHGRREIERLATGNQESMRNIGQDRIRQIRIPLPPLSEIPQIIAEIEHRFSAVTSMSRTVDLGLRRAERLRQSILKRAFEGKLVPQDPDDEPASALLERIRAERGTAPKARRRKASATPV